MGTDADYEQHARLSYAEGVRLMSEQVGKTLDGKGAVITGAGRGIGRAIALGYARAGASVCCAARTESEIRETVGEVRAEGGTAVAFQADVRQQESVQALFEFAEAELSGIDIAVLNAGVNLDRGPVEGGDPAAWEETIRTNLLGAYYCARSAIPAMKRRGGGKIITIGSGMGHRGIAESSAYSCSKAGLWMLTRVLAQELREHNISVNELIPGPVRTDIVSKLHFEGEWFKSPEDVVPMALFLATQPDIGPTAQSYSLMRRDT